MSNDFVDNDDRDTIADDSDTFNNIAVANYFINT